MGKKTTLCIFSKSGNRSLYFLPTAVLCLSAAIMSFSFTSCTSDDIDGADLQNNLNDSSQVTLNFKLAATRSTLGDGYVDATSIENNISSYRIYFFNSEDDTYIASFYPNDFSTEDNVTYSVSGTLRKTFVDSLSTIYNNKFNIVVIGNWDTYPDDDDLTYSTTIADICSGNVSTTDFTAKFDCPKITSEEEFQNIKIPVYGVHSYSDIVFSHGVPTTLTDNITMLKAMAKIEVADNTKSATRALYYPTIKSAKIIHYNSQGYCAPSGVNSEDDLDEDGYSTEINLIGGANDTQEAETGILDMYYDEETDKWIAYVPEYSNTDDDVDKCYIEIMAECVGDKDGDEVNDYDYTEYLSNPYKLYFCDYDEDGNVVTNTDRDLKRNHLYRFAVKFPKIYMLEAGDWDASVSEWHSKKR
ncbi:MAG: hypothetical protein LUC91_09290 [Prevotella sp.]|nr:hypothetical protein [Prevotella sp.]